MIRQITPDTNCKFLAIVDGQRQAIPHNCEVCDSMWTERDRGGGARYLVGGRWLCGACNSR